MKPEEIKLPEDKSVGDMLVEFAQREIEHQRLLGDYKELAHTATYTLSRAKFFYITIGIIIGELLCLILYIIAQEL